VGTIIEVDNSPELSGEDQSPVAIRLSLVSTDKGDVAQLGERLVCNQKVTGSIPVISSK
jgi:hypothetical protein